MVCALQPVQGVFMLLVQWIDGSIHPSVDRRMRQYPYILWTKHYIEDDVKICKTATNTLYN